MSLLSAIASAAFPLSSLIWLTVRATKASGFGRVALVFMASTLAGALIASQVFQTLHAQSTHP
jgi:hypothetical protein